MHFNVSICLSPATTSEVLLLIAVFVTLSATLRKIQLHTPIAMKLLEYTDKIAPGSFHYICHGGFAIGRGMTFALPGSAC